MLASHRQAKHGLLEFSLYALNNAGMFFELFLKDICSYLVDFQKSSTDFENWVMYVSMLSLKNIVSPQYDLQLPAAVGGTTLVAMSMPSIYHYRPKSSAARTKNLHLCIPWDPVNSSVVLHGVHMQRYISKDSRSGTSTVQIKTWSGTSCTKCYCGRRAQPAVLCAAGG